MPHKWSDIDEVEPPDDIDLLPLNVVPLGRPSAASLIVGIDAYRSTTPEATWVIEPIAAAGMVTLISGPPKAGKSTISAQIMRCRETGEPLFGAWDVATGPTLLVTEEGGYPVVYKTEGLHALDVLDRKAAAGLTFPQVLDVVREWSVAHPGGLVFIDTLAVWAGIMNENDASETTKALGLVSALAQATSLAIVLVHHSRKSGGEYGEAIRGSGAFLATVEISIELTRISEGSDDRHLYIQGRLGMPGKVRLEYDRDSMTYSMADEVEARLENLEEEVGLLPIDGDGLDLTALKELGLSRKRIQQLVNMGRVRVRLVREGRASKNRYWGIPPVEREWTPPME